MKTKVRVKGRADDLVIRVWQESAPEVPAPVFPEKPSGWVIEPRPCDRQGRRPLMRLTQSAYCDIMQEIGERPPERGGILLGPAGQALATHFVPDETGRGTSASWAFDHRRLNEIIRHYLTVRMDMLGFVHSHPPGYRQLSPQDIRDFQKPFANAKNTNLHEVWAPIVVDGALHPYILLRDDPDVPALAELILI
jgi:proteasome lid subunit RPN8/RPN11